MSTFTFRPATPSDARLLSDLGWRTFEEAFARYNKPEDMEAFRPTMYSPKIQAAELADPNTEFLIAEAEGEAIGYVKWNTAQAPPEITGKKPFQISRLYILNAFTGHGLGHQFMHMSLARAYEKRCDVVWLTVWESNDRAIKFYHKHDFREVGELEFILGQDVQRDLYMQRKILFGAAE